MNGDKVVATLTIHGAPDMTQKARLAIIEWLRYQSDHLYNENKEMAKVYTARYLVASKKAVSHGPLVTRYRNDC
jgi:hypothetical protein